MTSSQAQALDDAVPLDPPEWTDDELARFQEELLFDRHHQSLLEMRQSINLDFEHAFEWVLESVPSAQQLDLFAQATLAVTVLHWGLPH
jgi:hypothetical protein